MGLGINAVSKPAEPLKKIRQQPEERVIALAGNPNVGKSTVFNALTGLNQHTGNWPGKTVLNATGSYTYNGEQFTLVDIPGTYSLFASSAEEEVARDFLCFGGADTIAVVVDATVLERNLNLVLQILETTGRVVVCLNLMDEAGKKKIRVDRTALSHSLGVPVVGTSARAGKGLKELAAKIQKSASIQAGTPATRVIVRYDDAIEEAISMLEPAVEAVLEGRLCSRWVSLRLLDDEDSLHGALTACLGTDLLSDESVRNSLGCARAHLAGHGFADETLRDSIVSAIVHTSEAICQDAVTLEDEQYTRRDRRIDKLLTSRHTGIPLMLLLLGVILWITIAGANYPSDLLSQFFLSIQNQLTAWSQQIGAPVWLHDMLILGVYRTLTWVIAVMLPPMAIFFPLFTLLEDLGYLPRIAFNLDKYFKKAGAHGKQALTMCIVCISLLNAPTNRNIVAIHIYRLN